MPHGRLAAAAADCFNVGNVLRGPEFIVNRANASFSSCMGNGHYTGINLCSCVNGYGGTTVHIALIAGTTIHPQVLVLHVLARSPRHTGRNLSLWSPLRRLRCKATHTQPSQSIKSPCYP